VCCGCSDCGLSTGIGDGDGDSLGAFPSELVATWTFQSASISGTVVPLHQLFSWEAGSVACRITIQSDGTYVYQEIGPSDSVVWVEAGGFAVEGDSFTMTTEHPMLKSGTWDVDNDRLTLAVTTQARYTLVIEATR